MLKHVEQTVTLSGIFNLNLQESSAGSSGTVSGFFFNLLWLRVSGTPPINSRKGKNQNSMKSEWKGEKRNIYMHTKLFPQISSENQLLSFVKKKKKKNCAGGWDLITFKKPCLSKESRENKRVQRCAHSSICCSWVSACCRQWLPSTEGSKQGWWMRAFATLKAWSSPSPCQCPLGARAHPC